MKNILLIILINLTFTGCIKKYDDYYIRLKPYTKLTSLYTEFLTPSSYPEFSFETGVVHTSSKDRMHFIDRTIPNMMKEDIRIYSENLNIKEIIKHKLLDKKSNKNFEKYFENRPLTSWQITNHLDRKVEYYKNYVDYVAGLKCKTSVESQDIIANGIGSKNYYTTCKYFNKQGLPKTLEISYDFYYTFDRTKFERGDNPSLVRYKLKEIEHQFKKDMKEIFDSIQIYDIDRDRMKKEGLLYNKKYILTTESTVKDKSMECTMIKHKDYRDDYWICTGKETKRRCTNSRWISKDKWQCKEIP